MINPKYTEDFEQLWVTFDTRFGPKGSKPKAAAAYKAMKINKGDLAMIINAVINQQFEKERLISMGYTVANFKHVERYLRDRRFDDEPDRRTVPQRAISRRDSAREAINQPRERGAIEGDFEPASQLRIVK